MRLPIFTSVPCPAIQAVRAWPGQPVKAGILSFMFLVVFVVLGWATYAEAVAPMSGPMGSRSTQYVESICRTDPNVFFCEDFEDESTAPTPTGRFGDCNSGGGRWNNPGLADSHSCFNGGSRISPTIAIPGFTGTNRVWSLPVQVGSSTLEGYLKRGGTGRAYTAYYIRYQFYYTSNVTFPGNLDMKQFFTQPENFIDNPSADFQNGTMFHQDFFCSGVGNFGDVMVLRRSNGVESGYQFPFSPLPGQNQYCPPRAVGQAANNANAVRFQTNRWYTIEMHFILGSSNGTARMWVDGNLAYSFSNVRTCTSTCSAGMGYFFLTGYKGNGESGGGSVQFDNIVMSTSPIGPPGGGVPGGTVPGAPAALILSSNTPPASVDEATWSWSWLLPVGALAPLGGLLRRKRKV